MAEVIVVPAAEWFPVRAVPAGNAGNWHRVRIREAAGSYDISLEWRQRLHETTQTCTHRMPGLAVPACDVRRCGVSRLREESTHNQVAPRNRQRKYLRRVARIGDSGSERSPFRAVPTRDVVCRNVSRKSK